MRKFCVYEVDYPEEGGTAYDAETPEDAIRQHQEQTKTWGFEYGCCEMGQEHTLVEVEP